MRVAGAATLVLVAAACDLGAPPARYAVPGNTVGVGDVDGDGVPDVVSSGDDTAFGVRLGDGSGGFEPVTTIPHITPCRPGDPTLTCTNFRMALVGDLNGDDLADVTVSYLVGYPSAGEEWTEAEARLADGTGGFDDPIDIPGEGGFADVTGDGHVDRATTTDPFAGPLSLVVRPGDGLGHFGPAVTSDLSGLGQRIPGLHLHDVDADGDADAVLDGICVGGQGESWLLGCIDVLLSDGSGAFTPSGTRLVPGDVHVDGLGAALADVDGDGDADIVAGAAGAELDGPGTVGAVYAFLGDGTGAFGPEVVSPATEQTRSVTAGDFDGDGLADVLTVTEDGAPDTTDYARVLFSDGFGHFPDRHLLGTDGHGIVADLDVDGRSDYMTSVPGQVTVYLNRWEGRPD